jgi:hypothetical protein
MKTYKVVDVQIRVFLTEHVPGDLPRDKNARYQLDATLDGPQNHSGQHGEEKIPANSGTRTPTH